MRRWTLSLLFSLCLLAALAPRAEAIVVMGQAVVVDPRTIVVGGQAIRLYGIAPPGRGSICLNRRHQQVSCWEQSAEALAQLLEGREWYCEGNNLDAAHRLMGVCRDGSLVINELMVAHGWCRADRRHGHGYLQLEMNARRLHLGIWAAQ